MRMCSFFLCIFLLASLNIDGICGGDIPCDSEKIHEAVRSLQSSASLKETRILFEQFAECPLDASFFLVRELHEVPEGKILHNELELNENAETVHVVWCIRALRYLTNGMDFTGKTTHNPGNECDRDYIWNFLTGENKDELPFFAVWMSRDSLYTAPKDAQADIISKWNNWYVNDARTFKFKSSENLNDWYF